MVLTRCYVMVVIAHYMHYKYRQRKTNYSNQVVKLLKKLSGFKPNSAQLRWIQEAFEQKAIQLQGMKNGVWFFYFQEVSLQLNEIYRIYICEQTEYNTLSSRHL